MTEKTHEYDILSYRNTATSIMYIYKVVHERASFTFYESDICRIGCLFHARATARYQIYYKKKSLDTDIYMHIVSKVSQSSHLSFLNVTKMIR